MTSKRYRQSLQVNCETVELETVAIGYGRNERTGAIASRYVSIVSDGEDSRPFYDGKLSGGTPRAILQEAFIVFFYGST